MPKGAILSEAATAIHPAAPPHLPAFLAMPGETDHLMVGIGIMLVGIVFGFGLLYFKLHSLPEHMASGASKTQYQIVGVLALLALFTHNHLFWIAALLVALVQFPDFSTPMNSIARSLERLARPGEPLPADAAPPAALPDVSAEAPAPAAASAGARPADSGAGNA